LSACHFPLTTFSGSDQLNTVLSDAGTLGLGLLVATLILKLLTFAVSQGSGFVGAPIFPSLFIGGTAGSSSTRCSRQERCRTVPILIAVITAFLTIEGGDYLPANRKQARTAAAGPAAPA